MNNNYRRIRHLNETFKREISVSIQKMKDPRIHESIITLSDLYISPDFSFCKVYISTLKGINHSKKICKILNYASKYIQSSLYNKIKIRTIPKILFTPCDTTEYAFKIDSLISNINEKSSKERMERVINFLQMNDNFSIYTHDNPDGDAIGSSVALYLSLSKLGKNVRVLFEDNVTEQFKFMEGKISFEDFKPQHNICLDCTERSRLGIFRTLEFDLCIDHHDVDTCELSDLFYIDKTSSSTAEIIYEIVTNLDIDIDRDIANCIYTGILCDTGCFRWSNVNKRTFEISSKLINKVNKNITHEVFDNVPRSVMDFQSAIIKRFEYLNNCCIVCVPMKMREEFDLEYSDLKFLSSFPLQLKGIEISIVIKEMSKNRVRVSVRSFNGEALKLCKKFDGGGHENAAGFEVESDIDTIKNRIIRELHI